MKIRLSLLTSTLAILFSFGSVATVSAKTVSAAGDIVVVAPAQLPAAARQPGASLFLHRKNSDGSAYLYIKQQNSVALFDVTDANQIRALGTVAIPVAEPFVFAEAIGFNDVVLRSPAGKALALVDLRKPAAPALRTLPEPLRNDSIHNLSGTVYLATAAPATIARAPRDYSIYDFSNPEKPVLLSTARQVTASIERSETGTTFLLGADGLTVVRHPRTEEEFDGWLKQY